MCVRGSECEKRKKPTFVTAAQADAGCRANPHPLIRRPRTADPSLRFALARPAWEQDCVHFSCTHLLTTLLPGLVDSSVSMAGPLPQERERELGPIFFSFSLFSTEILQIHVAAVSAVYVSISVRLASEA